MAGFKVSIPREQTTKPPRVSQPQAPLSSRAAGIAAVTRAPGRFHPFNEKTVAPHWSNK